jgi:hypothetical protein
MFNLLHSIYRLGRYVDKTDEYYVYEYRSLRLRLFYRNDNVVFMVKGSN